MKSKVLKIGTVLFSCLCLFSFMTVPVSAVTNFYDVDFAISRPQVTNNVAYLEIVSQDGSDFYSYVVLLTMYTVTAKETSELRSCDFILSFTGDSDFIIGTGDADFYCSAVEISQDSDMYSFKPAISQSFFYPGHIVSIVPYGNIRLPNNLDDYNIGNFTFNYGTDTVSQNLLASILSVLENQSNSDITGAINSQTQQQHQDSQNIQQNANENAEDIMNNANSNAEDIQQNQDKNTQAEIEAGRENTETITDGWSGAENIDDSTANDFKDSESAALGGKSDSEIQAEVSNALDFDIGVFDSVKIGKIHSLFDDVLNVTGSWQSLFVLSLTLGLGAFLIGRRYG